MAPSCKTLPCLIALTLCGCASNPDTLPSAYVSAFKYRDFDCEQLGSEMENVSSRTNVLYNQLAKERSADNAQMGLGLVLFWPALFFLEGGDGPQAAEFSQMKGEFEALRQNSVAKKCDIDIQSPEQIMAAAAKEEQARRQHQQQSSPLRH